MTKKILISLLLILVLLVVGRLTIVYFKQKKEFDYHSSIPQTMTLWSDEFVPMGKIPLECSGKGNNLSPSLHWSNPPKGTRSLVLLMTDYDGPAPFLKLNTVDHWVVYNIPPGYGGIEKGLATSKLQNDSIRLGENFTKGIDYAGPKPPIGVHRYFFRIYALSVPALSLTTPKKQEVLEAMQGKVLAYGELIGKF